MCNLLQVTVMSVTSAIQRNDGTHFLPVGIRRLAFVFSPSGLDVASTVLDLASNPEKVLA